MALDKSVRVRPYRERAQPQSRVARVGTLLEKHKDYKERAQNFERRQKRLKALRERAATRNEDEFHHGMIRAQVKNGIHRSLDMRTNQYSHEYMQLLKTQDSRYVTMQKQVESKKVDRLLEQTMSIAAPVAALEEDDNDDTDDDEQVEQIKAKPMPKHTIFVDSTEQAKSFDPVRHFDTHEALIDRPMNRLRNSTLHSVPLTTQPVSVKAMKREQESLQRELLSRQKRLAKLDVVQRELETQRALMGKGRRWAVGKDANGLPIYKWAAQRKK